MTLAVAVGAPQVARAGAWIAPEGGQVIATAHLGEGESGLEALAEAPLDPRWSVLGVVRQDNSFSVEVAGKAVLWRHAPENGPHQIGAVQVGGFWRDADSGYACSQGGGEARGLYGLGFGTQFLNVEAAYRTSGTCHSVRLEGTAGWRPSADWLTMAQVFTHQDDGDVVWTTVQASAVYMMQNGRGVQVGLRWRERDQASAVIVGLWSRLW